MRKNVVKKVLSFVAVAALSTTFLTGCGSKEAATEEAAPEVTVEEETVAKDAEPEVTEESTVEATEEATEETIADQADSYFKAGVYASYAADEANPEKTFFYIFEGDGCGHTDDAVEITGKFFTYEQLDGSVKFEFGSDETVEDILTIKSVENGVVTGSFKDSIDLVFEPVADADPFAFDAVNYVNAANGEDLVYEDPNGWRIKYDPELFEITSAGPMTSIVYTGESAGTNMILVNYTIDNNAEGAVKELGEAYGDKAHYTEGTFPGTKDVKGYWVSVDPDMEGSHAYMTAIARDYMDGALVFEIDGHVSDDEFDTAVEDALAGIIDSIEWPYEN